jgi:hypothetical protein
VSAYMIMNCWAGLQQAQILSHSAESPPPSGGVFRTEYMELVDPSVQARVRARHGLKIAPLQSLGFQQFAYPLEVLPPYSAISRFPVVLMMFNKEVLVFPNLRVWRLRPLFSFTPIQPRYRSAWASA